MKTKKGLVGHGAGAISIFVCTVGVPALLAAVCELYREVNRLIRPAL